MTGRDLAEHARPLDALCIVATDAVRRDLEDLARTLGEAIGDRPIPGRARVELASALAMLVVYPDAEGEPASTILEAAGERLDAGVADDAHANLTRWHGYDVADVAIAELRTLGAAIFGALEDRNVPDAARNSLTAVISAIADHRSGIRR